jgi:hypothetical protein
MDDDSQVVRVYEGKTPQLAWQSAMLEKIGLDEEDESAVERMDGDDAVKSAAVSLVFDEEDAAEKSMRMQVMEKRRSYMRALSQGQVDCTVLHETL